MMHSGVSSSTRQAGLGDVVRSVQGDRQPWAWHHSWEEADKSTQELQLYPRKAKGWILVRNHFQAKPGDRVGIAARQGEVKVSLLRWVNLSSVTATVLGWLRDGATSDPGRQEGCTRAQAQCPTPLQPQALGWLPGWDGPSEDVQSWVTQHRGVWTDSRAKNFGDYLLQDLPWVTLPGDPTQPRAAWPRKVRWGWDGI